MRKPLYFSKRESCRQCCSDLLMANTLIVCVQVSSVSGSVLETIFKQWDSQGNLQCSSQIQSSRPVYIVQTTGGDAAAHNAFYVLHFIALQLSLSFSLSLFENPPPIYLSSSCLIADAGFLGLLSGLPKELERLFPDTAQQDSQSSAGVP